ncbi:glucuronokinase with putative uridyl pyrophosphorylase isoform X2 [Trichomycterus rosablanca]
MVIAGDMLCSDQNLDIAQVIRFFRSKTGELAIYYELEEGEKCSTRGIVEVCPDSHSIKRFLEKPQEGVTLSRLASVVFYCLRKETLSYLSDFLHKQPDVEYRTLGRFWEWLINEEKLPVFGMKLPTGFQLIGQVGLSDYTKWLAHYSTKQQDSPAKPITFRSYARVGLMGNPSDGFHGKTIAMSISNFWAEVTLIESHTLVLLPHPLNDPTEFGSLQDLFRISHKEGYLGGLRLLQATCKKFYQFCSSQGIALTKQNFTLKYDTNIPRQVGLAGSSAIVSSTLKCLMKFYNLTENDLPKPIRANFILNVETDELFITAGLQDRVVQVYEGLVYMDFNKETMDKQGYGNYITMDMSDLPTFWLAYLGDPSDSGRIHSNVRQRWLNGDPDVVEVMKQFAELTDQARADFQSKDWPKLAELMDRNFELRRSVYTDDCLGSGNLRMVQLARQFGSAVKLPGSGGAVVGLCLDPEQMEAMKRAFQEAGFVFCLVVPHNPAESAVQRSK